MESIEMAGVKYNAIFKDDTAALDCIHGQKNIDVPASIKKDGKEYTVKVISFIGDLDNVDITESISIPESVMRIFIEVKTFPNLKTFDVAKNNKSYVAVDGILYSRRDKYLVLERCLVKPKDKTVQVLGSAREIAISAFSGAGVKYILSTRKRFTYDYLDLRACGIIRVGNDWFDEREKKEWERQQKIESILKNGCIQAENCILLEDGTKLIFVTHADKLNIPDGVKTIARDAFPEDYRIHDWAPCSDKELKSIRFPDSYEGKFVIAGSEHFEIPGKQKKIIFDYDGVYSLEIRDGACEYLDINCHSFYGDMSNDAWVTELTLPDSVKTLSIAPSVYVKKVRVCGEVFDWGEYGEKIDPRFVVDSPGNRCTIVNVEAMRDFVNDPKKFSERSDEEKHTNVETMSSF